MPNFYFISETSKSLSVRNRSLKKNLLNFSRERRIQLKESIKTGKLISVGGGGGMGLQPESLFDMQIGSLAWGA